MKRGFILEKTRENRQVGTRRNYFYSALPTVLFPVMMLIATALSGQSGTAFRDFNGDGLQTGAEPGVEGIIVKLYANGALPVADQLIGEAVTDAGGNFNFAVSLVSGRAANPGELVRIEFSIPPAFECSLAETVDFEGMAGAVFGSSVQFITGQEANIKFAINYPGQWVQNNNPDVYLPCYAFGNPFAPGNNVANDPAFITYKFLDNGVPAPHNGGTPGVPTPNLLSTVAEVGSLYGVAFSRPAQKIFSSAVIRRHCGLGPLGPGGIYLVDPNEPGADKTTDFLDLDAIGIHTWNHSEVAYPPNPGNNTSPVTGYVGSNFERNLPGDRFQPSTDYAAGDQVGKVSIGDIDISDDGRYLYVMNLWDRKVYEIDLVDPRNPQAPTLANVATRVRSWDVPDPGTSAAQGEHRPWGLKYYRGKLYVGLVLSGQNLAGNVVSPIINGNGSDIRGYVYEFDPITENFSVPLLNFSFSYGRERPWIPWGYSTLSGLSRYFSGTEREVAEPIIADIEFDDEGNMLIGLMDRKGHQYAINTHNYAGNLINYEYSTAGELLRANASIVNGVCQYSIVTRPGTADYYNDNLWHSESVQGPLAVLPGAGEALAVWLDPILIRSGGTIRLNNTTGAQVANSAYEVFDDRWTLGQPGATASKANGLGDVELEGSPAPVELGNLIWADFDGDGVQDSGEPGLEGVDVQLKTPGGQLLATVTTNSNGNYFFNFNNVPDGDPATPGNQPGPQPFADYKICIPASEFAVGGPLHNFLLTPDNRPGAGLADYSDSDGILLGNGDVQI
ncbi:MAG: SdrD B-like domain-containing protein, partial [Saprospiraceae bacterium]|nr:SdrD B-like domain-containing protein [Saprospiraceae bacterium]